MMPPPNVTGSLHMGHALTFTLQDILIRFYKNLEKMFFGNLELITQELLQKLLLKNNLLKKKIVQKKLVGKSS